MIDNRLYPRWIVWGFYISVAMMVPNVLVTFNHVMHSLLGEHPIYRAMGSVGLLGAVFFGIYAKEHYRRKFRREQVSTLHRCYICRATHDNGRNAICDQCERSSER